MVCLADHVLSNFLKGCLPEILLGPLLNTLSQITLRAYKRKRIQLSYLSYLHFIHMHYKTQTNKKYTDGCTK